MFDRIAPRYDLLNHLLSAGIDIRWRRAAVDFLDLRMPGRVLDVCSGTADLLIEALGRDAARRGAGVDLSGEMLVRGRRKLLARGMRERGVLAAGDAERLPLRGGLFDGVLVAFGIRNVGDPAAALREMARVLRPAGRAVVLEFSMPRGIVGRLYRFYFRNVLPRVGGLLSEKSAYSYLPASVERFATPEAFAALMGESGFVDVRVRRLTGGIAHLYRGEKA